MVFLFSFQIPHESGVKNCERNNKHYFSFVLLVGLLCLMNLAANYLTTKTSAIRIDERIRENELTRIGLDIAEKAIKTVVESSVGKLEELIAKDLRPKVKNGEANNSELQALAGEAYSEVIKTVSRRFYKGWPIAFKMLICTYGTKLSINYGY